MNRRELFGMMAGAAVAPMLPAAPLFAFDLTKEHPYFGNTIFYSGYEMLLLYPVEDVVTVLERMNA